MRKFRRLLHFIKTILYYKVILKNIGALSVILNPLKIEGSRNIAIGNRVYIAYKTWLAAVAYTGSEACQLVIEDGCVIGNFNHIYATKSIRLQKNVLTADKVYISDNLHGYENTDLPILRQPIKQLATVVLGEGCWIGENVCIIGASVGKNSVIGANSVVTKSIPDYCVAVGSPARIIKRYCIERQEWRKTDIEGNYLDL